MARLTPFKAVLSVIVFSGFSMAQIGPIPPPSSSGTGGTYCSGSGTNTITCTGSPVPKSYVAGMIVSLHAGGTNTAAATLNINSLGAKNILLNGSALAAGNLTSGNSYLLAYDGTQFNLQPSGSSPMYQIPFGIDGGGSVIPLGGLGVYSTVNFACTIIRIDITGTPSGSVTVDVWKAAGAIPTNANKISASAPLTLSSSQLHQAGSLAGWTTAVSVGDVFGFSVATATTVTSVSGVIWCQ